jgi:hypothetical protein
MDTEIKKEGIETIKKVSKDVIDTIKEFVNDYEDKKISKSEWLAKIDNAIILGKDFFKYDVLASEFIDLDAEEGEEYINYISSLGIGDQNAKFLAIYIVQFIDAQIDCYKKIVVPAIELIKSIKK